MKNLIVLISLISTQVFAAETIKLSVTSEGFIPKQVQAKTGEEVNLEITRTTDATCSTKISIPSLKITKDLPLNEKVVVPLGKVKSGDIRFGCAMDLMDSGIITVN